MRFRTFVHRLGSPERRGKRAGRVKIAGGIPEGVAGRYGRATGICFAGIFGGCGESSEGYRPPSPHDNPACPPTTSPLVEGYTPPQYPRMARIVSGGAPPVAFQAGACGWGGIPNPAMTHPSDNAGAKPPDKGHFSVSTQLKTPLRYG